MEHRPDAAIGLVGYASAVRDQISHPRVEVEDRQFEMTLQTARNALCPLDFAYAWNQGQRWSSEEMSARIDAIVAEISVIPTINSARWHNLTPREVEVLKQLAKGKSNKAIAEVLSVSQRTIENHIFNLRNKLGVESRAAAATFAVQNGLVHSSPVS